MRLVNAEAVQPVFSVLVYHPGEIRRVAHGWPDGLEDVAPLFQGKKPQAKVVISTLLNHEAIIP